MLLRPVGVGPGGAPTTVDWSRPIVNGWGTQESCGGAPAAVIWSNRFRRSPGGGVRGWGPALRELDAADPRQVGRYRILARLGAGGMGRVYLGRSTSGRMVAVKVVRAELAEDPDFQRRFAREVEAARRVNGFFTAAVVDADPTGSPAWLATAYVPGLPLDGAVRAHGTWPRRSLVHLGAGLAEALEAIHGTGVIHRDLKPSNVLIAGDGPRVIDFGISIASEASVLTQTGMVIGTPGFMSPEQVTGRTVGPASDVFSLGAVLAFAGTGAGPFGSGAPHSVNFRAVYEEPDLGGLPPGTEFVGRCLEKDPGRRPTVPELLTELARILGETGGQTYAGGLPKETDWLPEAVASALPGRTAAPEPAPAEDPARDRSDPVGAGGRPEPGSGLTRGAVLRAATAPAPDPRIHLAKSPAAPPAPTAPTAPTAPPGVPAAADDEQPAPPATERPVATDEQPAPSTDEQAVAEPSVAAEERPAPPTDEQAVAEPSVAAEEPPAPSTPPSEPAAVTDEQAASRPPADTDEQPAPPATEPPVVTDRPLATRPTSPGRLPAQAPGRAKRRRLAAIALTLVLVTGGGITALLADRGGDGDKSEGKRDDTASSARGFDAAVGAVVNASDRKGGTLRLASSGDADSWDPARSYYGWVWNMQRLYARTLLTYEAGPGSKGLGLVPDLAAARPEVSPDGRTYTVKLRPGLKFEDGTPITSRDVKYGIERVFAQDTVSGGPTYLVEALDQKQNYPGPYEDAGNGGLKSVGTPDDLTLVFRLAKADSRFPYLLAMGATAPVPRQKDTGARYGEKPVSSGPYRFESYRPGKSLLLVRNGHWDRATDPLRKALPDRIELTVSSDDDVASRLLAGTADLDARQAGLTQTAARKVLGDPKLKSDADNPHNGYLHYVSLVSKTAPLDNVHCRKAVLYAADPTALHYARGGPKTGSLRGSMLPPTVLGADDYDPFGLTDGKPEREKAKAELRACGKPDGFTTTIAVRSVREKEVQSAVVLQSALEAVGITAEIEQYDALRYYDEVGSPRTVEDKGYGLLMLAWGADYPTGSGFLQPLADGRLITQTGNTNHSGIDDPEINDLFDRAAAATDPAEATRIHRRVNHAVTDGAYYLPITAGKSLNYRNPRLTNVYVHQAFGMVDFQALGTSGASG
ncbi:ABC transporter substrate-binding protein [Streptomyces kurssanovii]|uniref:ABC transporter substrate-binding protein n=1 Tax=Streptomyces kurssanovii TaxID=67312 RepID=A0ABV3HW42_9ACTN